MSLTDLPNATLPNDPGQTEEQHRTPDVQKTPEHNSRNLVQINLILIMEFLLSGEDSHAPHEDALDPSKLDHFPPPRVYLVLLLHPLLDL